MLPVDYELRVCHRNAKVKASQKPNIAINDNAMECQLGTGHWALGTGHWALGTGWALPPHSALETRETASGTGAVLAVVSTGPPVLPLSWCFKVYQLNQQDSVFIKTASYSRVGFCNNISENSKLRPVDVK